MPRYFFNIADSIQETDDDGQVLAGPHEARVQAIAFAGALLKDDPDLVWDGHEFSVYVTDEAGSAVCTVFVRAEDAVGTHE